MIRVERFKKIKKEEEARKRRKKNKSTHVINCESFNEQSIILTL